MIIKQNTHIKKNKQTTKNKTRRNEHIQNNTKSQTPIASKHTQQNNAINDDNPKHTYNKQTKHNTNT